MNSTSTCPIADNTRNHSGCGCCGSAGRWPSLFIATILIWVASINLLAPLWAGIAAGASTVAILMFALMPRMMIVQHKSVYSLDETLGRLKDAAEQRGWLVPAIRNVNESMEKQSVTFAKQVRILELCKAEYSSSVLGTDRHLATLMPCAFGVYEGDDGNIWVSAMNTSLMGKMFGGNVARIMGGKVAKEEREILKTIRK